MRVSAIAADEEEALGEDEAATRIQAAHRGRMGREGLEDLLLSMYSYEQLESLLNGIASERHPDQSEPPPPPPPPPPAAVADGAAASELFRRPQLTPGAPPAMARVVSRAEPFEL